MALQSSGAISLNDIHVEVGGTSGTAVSLNDADVRALIGKASGASNSISEYYGASSVSYSAFASWASANYPATKSGSYQSGIGRVTPSCSGPMWGGPGYGYTTDDSNVAMWAYHSIQHTTAANYLAGSRVVVWSRSSYAGSLATASSSVHSCTSYGYSAWACYYNDCYYYDSYLNAYRKMTSNRGSFSNFSGP